MGTWAIPWEDEASCEAFTRRMAAPWVAKVALEQLPDWGPMEVGDQLRTLPDGTSALYRKSGFLRRWKRVPPVGTRAHWDADVPELYQLFGDDELFDALAEEAEQRQGDFDARPLIEHRLREVLDDHGADLADDETLPVLNRLRGLVGLAPL